MTLDLARDQVDQHRKVRHVGLDQLRACRMQLLESRLRQAFNLWIESRVEIPAWDCKANASEGRPLERATVATTDRIEQHEIIDRPCERTDLVK